MGSWLWGCVLDGVGILASWMLARRIRFGWLVSLFNLLVFWTAYSVVMHQWGFFPGIGLYAYVAWRGWWNWRE